MSLVPITDWALKTPVPIKGKEEHRAIVEVSEDINGGMNHASEYEPQPPMSARVGLFEEAPKKYGIDDKRGG